MIYFQYIITWSNGATEIFYDPDNHVTFKSTSLYNDDRNRVDVNLSHARKIYMRYRYKWEDKKWVCQDA